MPAIIEIIVRPNPRGYGPFSVYLGETLACRTEQPFFAGARALLKLGYSPDAVYLMRHQGSAHVSFVPTTLGKAAKLTAYENDMDGLRVRAYEPRPPKANRKREGLSSHKIDSKPEGGTVHGKEIVLGTFAA
ncbi:hypothetical protein [Methylobacterium soli]|uniref:Uncharacterized protein n=1 Tax=Methylobacterium soli TaxID=553447 RepID=A0A6L3SST8_9HYPH|nr:hypothetical protein [Methylobacterium soli]KAB1073848.1 hypothetical protein F6X53_26640 [Methylobacterium soli]GJE46833.1 hypothetical protein AEGHOMDF_6042 [Methylobacterium soli]